MKTGLTEAWGCLARPSKEMELSVRGFTRGQKEDNSELSGRKVQREVKGRTLPHPSPAPGVIIHRLWSYLWQRQY